MLHTMESSACGGQWCLQDAAALKLGVTLLAISSTLQGAVSAAGHIPTPMVGDRGGNCSPTRMEIVLHQYIVTLWSECDSQ
jgi:hypothetical protein